MDGLHQRSRHVGVVEVVIRTMTQQAGFRARVESDELGVVNLCLDGPHGGKAEDEGRYTNR